MPTLQTQTASAATRGRLFFLDASTGGRVVSARADGSDRRVIVTECRTPDGVAVDADAGHLYWTNMGVPSENDGSIERVDLDGSHRCTIVPKGSTFTPKQLHLDKASGKLYWSDREGMRVMRANLDGSDIETLIENGSGDADRRDVMRWCVGITVDPERGFFYWTQKGPEKAGRGRILRARLDGPVGEGAKRRGDVEVLFEGLPEPIDLEIDREDRMLYWTDRGDPPLGNTVNRAPTERVPGTPPEVLMHHLKEGIGIALDSLDHRMFVTDLAGSVYSANLDGSDARVLLTVQGNLTGIAYVELR